MTYEEVKRIRDNPSSEDVDNDELSRMIDKAIDKQIAKKYELWNGQCCCPTCKKIFGGYPQLKTLIHWEMPHCKYCGQALDWSDEE